MKLTRAQRRCYAPLHRAHMAAFKRCGHKEGACFAFASVSAERAGYEVVAFNERGYVARWFVTEKRMLKSGHG